MAGPVTLPNFVKERKTSKRLSALRTCIYDSEAVTAPKEGVKIVDSRMPKMPSRCAAPSLQAATRHIPDVQRVLALRRLWPTMGWRGPRVTGRCTPSRDARCTGSRTAELGRQASLASIVISHLPAPVSAAGGKEFSTIDNAVSPCAQYGQRKKCDRPTPNYSALRHISSICDYPTSVSDAGVVRRRADLPTFHRR